MPRRTLNVVAQRALSQAMTSEKDAMTKFLSARALLAFYEEAGADALVGEMPVDRLAADAPRDAAASVTAGASPQAAAAQVTPPRGASAARAVPPQPPRTISARDLDTRSRSAAAPPPAPEAAVMTARAAAKGVASLEELRAILDRFEGCALRTTATRLVFADGNPHARVMFVGEAPGRDEDIEGLPFVGRSGKLLDRMMAAIGLDRRSAYIANIIPWRPPGNRTPTPQESAICLPFILRQIELADPDVLVCMGGPSAMMLLNTNEGILKTRGRWFTHHTGTRDIRALATLHPAYLLRQPLQKRLAWRDFLAIKKALTTT
jgi:uracil-DNA glycosylase